MHRSTGLAASCAAWIQSIRVGYCRRAGLRPAAENARPATSFLIGPVMRRITVAGSSVVVPLTLSVLMGPIVLNQLQTRVPRSKSRTASSNRQIRRCLLKSKTMETRALKNAADRGEVVALAFCSLFSISTFWHCLFFVFNSFDWFQTFSFLDVSLYGASMPEEASGTSCPPPHHRLPDVIYQNSIRNSDNVKADSNTFGCNSRIG